MARSSSAPVATAAENASDCVLQSALVRARLGVGEVRARKERRGRCRGEHDLGLLGCLLGAAGAEQRLGTDRTELGSLLDVGRHLERPVEESHGGVGLGPDELERDPEEPVDALGIAGDGAEGEVARHDRRIGAAVEAGGGLAVPPDPHRFREVLVQRLADQIVAEREHVAGRLEEARGARPRSRRGRRLRSRPRGAWRARPTVRSRRAPRRRRARCARAGSTP